MSVNAAIERFAADMGWVVKYAKDGTPNFFYPIYKCKSSDLDPSLPEHVHPAFIVNNKEIDRRLIAVYKGSLSNGAIHSIANMPPRVSAGADQLLAEIKAAGDGFGPKTVADSGLLLLLARKYNWTPKGNITMAWTTATARPGRRVRMQPKAQYLYSRACSTPAPKRIPLLPKPVRIRTLEFGIKARGLAA